MSGTQNVDGGARYGHGAAEGFCRVGRARPLILLAPLLLAAAAAGPAAADDCPNAQYRTGASAALPECRAYELVSPPDKNGNAVIAGLRARDSGGAIAYGTTGAFAGAPSSIGGNYVSERTPGGWTTRPLNPGDPGRPAEPLRAVARRRPERDPGRQYRRMQGAPDRARGDARPQRQAQRPRAQAGPEVLIGPRTL